MQQVVKRDEASLSPEGRPRRSCLPCLPYICFLAVLFTGEVLRAQQAPEISVNPSDAVVFGSKAVNSKHRRSLFIKNVGTALLEVTQITLVPAVADFRIVSGADPIAIAPGAEVSVEILYSPTQVHEDSGRLEIQSNDADEPLVTVRLSGFGILEPEPEIRVTPRALAFDEVSVGASNTMSAIITSSGLARLQVLSVQLSPGTSGDFSLGGFTGPVSLPLGASLNAKVTYTPGEVGADAGMLLIESDDAEQPVVAVSLSGTGVLEAVPRIQITPTAIDFMETFVGTSNPMSIEITNTGSAPLDLTSIDLGPGTSDDFSITGPSEAIAVAPGASVTTEVTYGPSDEGADSGTLVIDSNDTTRPVLTVSLVGVGVPLPAPQIQVTPSALDFTDVFLDSSSLMSVEITNTGTASLEITNIALGPGTSADFALTGFAEPVSLAPGASVTTEVTYTPGDLGVDSGTLVIDSNDAGESHVTVSLAGTGVPAPIPRIQVTAPLVLNYGMVLIGASSTMSVGIGNIGTAPLEISGIVLGPNTSTDFEITGFSDSISLVPGGSVTTEVTYTPGDTGADSGTLVIESNDSDQPAVTVSLTGSGVPVPVARIRVTPTSLGFAEVFIGSSSSMTVEIANIGTALLDVSRIHLGPETSGDFTLSGFNQRIILVPDASVLTEITYTPTDEGADSGTLMIESDDADMGTSIVSLSGVGVPEPMPRIAVTPAALDYDQVHIGAESTRQVTIGNSGMETLEISFVGLGAETRGEFLISSGPGSASVPPGEQITVDVTYAPSDAGADSGTLRIESNDNNDPIINVSLSGTGVAAPLPKITVDPTALLFGEVPIGDSIPMALSISNTGSAPLALLDITLGTATSTDFAVTGGPASVDIGPGEETTVEVTYTPTDPGTDSGTLRIESNDPEDPRITVSLFGLGEVTGEPRFRRGDANTNGFVDLGDPIKTIGFLFRDEPAPTCFDAADSNDDGNLNLSDGIFTLSWLFNGGPASPPPGADSCGPDPTEDGLSLCFYPFERCVD